MKGHFTASFSRQAGVATLKVCDLKDFKTNINWAMSYPHSAPVTRWALYVSFCSPPEFKEITEFCALLRTFPTVRSLTIDVGITPIPSWAPAMAPILCEGLQDNLHLRELDFTGIPFNDSKNISSLSRLLPSLKFLQKLTLAHNNLNNSEAIQLANAFFTHRAFGSLHLRGPYFTDDIVDFVVSQPDIYNIQIGISGLSATADERLKKHAARKAFRDRHHNFSTFWRTYNKYYLNDAQISKILNELLSAVYTETDMVEEQAFISRPSPYFVLSQFLKGPGEKRLWKNLYQSQIVRKVKPVIWCAFPEDERILHALIARCPPELSIKLWEGDPLLLTQDRTPAGYKTDHAENVRNLLAAAMPEDAEKYQIIDHTRLQQLLRQCMQFSCIKADHCQDRDKGQLTMVITHMFRDDDIASHLYPTVRNETLASVVAGIPKSADHIRFRDCRFLDVDAMLTAVEQFPSLRGVDFGETKPFNLDQINRLFAHCPGLTWVTLAINTVAPLAVLSKFKNASFLRLDLSENRELTSLDLLLPVKDRIMALNLNGCTHLSDLTALVHFKELQDLYLGRMPIGDIQGLFDSLAKLEKLRLFALHDCTYRESWSQAETFNLVSKLHWNVQFSFSLEDPQVNSLSQVGATRIASLLEKSLQSTKPPVPMPVSVESSVVSKKSLPFFNYHVKQKFRLSDGSWHDLGRMDREGVTDRIVITAEGRIKHAPPPLEQMHIEIISGVEVRPEFAEDGIDISALQQYEADAKAIDGLEKRFYSAEIGLKIFRQEWVRATSLGLSAKPVACSYPLVWGRSKVTGELFVRLPADVDLQSVSGIIHFVTPFEQEGPKRLFLPEAELPAKLRAVLKMLVEPDETPENKALRQCRQHCLEQFPHFARFIENMKRYRGDTYYSYTVIREYCAFGHKKGFASEKLEEKQTTLVQTFIATLPPALRASINQDDLKALLDTLLQRRGACMEAAQTFKLLCDYYRAPCHMANSVTHAFPEYPVTRAGEELMIQDDLGGGGHAFVDYQHLPQRSPDSKKESKSEPKKPTGSSSLAPRERHYTTAMPPKPPAQSEQATMMSLLSSTTETDGPTETKTTSAIQQALAPSAATSTPTSLTEQKLPALSTTKSALSARPPSFSIDKLIQQFKSAYKPVLPSGASEDFPGYWRQLLSHRNRVPLLNLPPEDKDGIQFLASLKQFVSEANPFSLSPQRLFPIFRVQELEDFLEGSRIADNKSTWGPQFGELGRLLVDGKPSVVVVNVGTFLASGGSLMELQALGDTHRTLKDVSLSAEVRVIFLMQPELVKEGIVLSRSQQWQYRGDLFKDAKRISFLPSLPRDNVPLSKLPKVPLHGDATRASSRLWGGPSLEDDHLTFADDGVLTQAIAAKQPVILTGVPQTVCSPLYRMKLTEQLVANGEARVVPPEVVVFNAQPEKLPDLKWISSVELKACRSQFYLNHHSYQLLVHGVRQINPSNGVHRTTERLLVSKQLPEAIVLTVPLNASMRSELTAVVQERDSKLPPAQFYFCRPSAAHFSAARNRIIQAEKPQAALAALLTATPKISASDVLVLTSDDGLDLLMQVESRDDRRLRYKEGWLLSRLRSAGSIVLVGWNQSLYYAIESLFMEFPYLEINGELLEARAILAELTWIVPKDVTFPALVCVQPATPSPVALIQPRSEAPAKPMVYRENVDKVARFMTSSERFIELIGPPGAGKTASVGKVITRLRKLGQSILHFNKLADYAVWRKDHPEDKTTLTILQLDDCRLLSEDRLGFLYNIQRRGEICWQGEIMAAPAKIVLTNNPGPDRQSHTVLRALRPEAVEFAPFTEAEIKSEILLPLLQEIKGLAAPQAEVVAALILQMHQYVGKQLPYAGISIRELTTVCQELKVKLPVLFFLWGQRKDLVELEPSHGKDFIAKMRQRINKELPDARISIHELMTMYQALRAHPSLSLAQFIQLFAGRACYRQFFGLFARELERKKMWRYLLNETQLPVDLEPIPIELSQLQQEFSRFYLTEPNAMIILAVENLLQLREGYLQQARQGVNAPGKCGVLLEGPPGILKTELTIALLTNEGFQPAPPAKMDAKTEMGGRYYVNLTTSDPQVLETELLRAYRNGWVFIWNESNFFKKPTLNLLLELLEAPKTGFVVVFTQNKGRNGAKPLPAPLRSRLQPLPLRDYKLVEYEKIAKHYGFNSQARIIARMFVALQDYQQQNSIVVATSRHYFALLSALESGRVAEPVGILEGLMATCCNPILPPDGAPGQRAAVDFMLDAASDDLELWATSRSLSTVSLLAATASSFAPGPGPTLQSGGLRLV